jgi:hypothetical protein
VVAVHQKLALVIVLLSLAGVLWAVARVSNTTVSPRLIGLAWLTVAAVVLQAIAGIVLAARGTRPADATHFLFGPATLFALPVALLARRGRPARAESYIVLAGWLATLVLSLRDVGTGGL